MSKHLMVEGQILQMNKTYSQLKNKQKEKISNWMYEAYKRQVKEQLSDEDALQYVFERIEKAKIWIPDYEIEKRYASKKNQFKKRLEGENIPPHLFQMEGILNRATQRMDALEKKMEEYITRNKARAATAGMANSRQKMLDRIDVMQKLIDFCTERNYKPVYIIPPTTEYLAEYFTDDFQRIYIYDFLKQVNRNIPIFDYSQSKELMNKDFYFNSYFLNKHGAKVFTQKVIKDLSCK